MSKSQETIRVELTLDEYEKLKQYMEDKSLSKDEVIQAALDNFLLRNVPEYREAVLDERIKDIKQQIASHDDRINQLRLRLRYLETLL